MTKFFQSDNVWRNVMRAAWPASGLPMISAINALLEPYGGKYITSNEMPYDHLVFEDDDEAVRFVLVWG